MSDSPTAAIVMSRLPRLIDPRASWLLGLRVALRDIADRGETLLIAEGTTRSDFVRRGAELLGIRTRSIELSRETGFDSDSKGEFHPLPIADRTLMNRADRVIVLSLRANGNLHQLLNLRVSTGKRVELLNLADLQATAARNDLLARGAELLEASQQLGSASELGTGKQEAHGPTEPFSTKVADCYEIVPFPQRENWSMLSHTTRACAGPWPNDSNQNYIDSLLDGRPDADHSPLSALIRIVTQRRLIASPRGNRGGHPVVSFTSVPLIDLPQLHCFRPHRGRWDFEPFGICIRSNWLECRGTRSVIYGDEQTWSGLTSNDRPFFQLAHSGSTKKVRASDMIDWTVEREWRHAGDLDLSTLPAEDAFVFVPDAQAARRVSMYSPWPVTLWPDPKFSNNSA